MTPTVWLFRAFAPLQEVQGRPRALKGVASPSGLTTLSHTNEFTGAISNISCYLTSFCPISESVSSVTRFIFSVFHRKGLDWWTGEAGAEDLNELRE